MKTLTTELNQLTLRDDGILVVRSINADTPRTTDPVRRMYGELAELIESQPCPILWDPRAIRTIRPDGWLAIIDRLQDLFVAIAILVDNDATRAVMGSYPHAFATLLIPARVFEDEDEAMEWLGQFVQV